MEERMLSRYTARLVKEYDTLIDNTNRTLNTFKAKYNADGNKSYVAYQNDLQLMINELTNVIDKLTFKAFEFAAIEANNEVIAAITKMRVHIIVKREIFIHMRTCHLYIGGRCDDADYHT